MCKLGGRDHNATSYSTETNKAVGNKEEESRRDHNATSYSTETLTFVRLSIILHLSRDHNATSYSTETLRRSVRSNLAIFQQRS